MIFFVLCVVIFFLANIFCKNISDTNIIECSMIDKKLKECKKDVYFAKCCELLDNEKNVFITGGAGVGKSTLLKKIVKFYPDMYLTSTTSISAYNINGITLHSFLGVGLCNNTIDKTINKIKNNKELYTTLQKCKLLAIDEISMLGYKQFVYMDAVLKSVKNSMLPFGGIQLVIIGDFFQLPPVKDDYVFVNNNSLWRSFDFQPIILTKIWRQNDTEFIKNLNRIRIGNIDNSVIDFFKDNIKRDSSIYDDITHFYPHKYSVNKFNKKQLEKLQTESFKILAEDYIATFNPKTDDYILHSQIQVQSTFREDNNRTIKTKDDKIAYDLSKYTLSRQELVLKKGCKVLITKNLSPDIVNGTTGIFKDFINDKLIVSINGNDVYITKEQFEIKKMGYANSLVRKQYPIILAYALTIHKSQGLTLNSAVIKIDKSFANGQVYVAMSRVIDKDNLIIIGDFSRNNILTSSQVKDFYKKLEEK